MAECKLCGRSGLFLRLAKIGVCKACEPAVLMDVSQRVRIISDSIKLVEKSRKLEVQVARCDLILEHAQALMNYESRGIITVRPEPSALCQQYSGVRDRVIQSAIEREAEEATVQLRVTGNARANINRLTKVLLRLRRYKPELNTAGLLDQIEKTVVNAIHTTQLGSYLDDARKAEFKGQKKKALDGYRDALYFLRHDEVDDSLQAEHISNIERKITELSGSPPEQPSAPPSPNEESRSHPPASASK